MENKMTYTFDEAIDKILFDSFEDTHDYDVVYTEDVVSLIKKLKEEYAPTVEMTEGQAKTILDPEEGKDITNLLTDETQNFDYLFWEPMTGKEVVQAWLYPETIKVVDE